MSAMAKRRKSKVRYVVVRCALGAIFLWAGAGKILNPSDFYSALLAYNVALPDIFLRFVAIALPWLEVFCGGVLLVDFWMETVGPFVPALCLVFVLMLGQAVVRGLDLNCGCLGVTGAGWFDRPIMALARAGALLWGAIWLALNRADSPPDQETPASCSP